MRTLIKVLMCWCLLFALPLQAIAAAGIFACQHTAASSAPACHETAAVAADGAAQLVDGAAEEACDACSICGLGAAMAPPRVLSLDAPERHALVALTFLVRLPTVTPETLERPPRHALA